MLNFPLIDPLPIVLKKLFLCFFSSSSSSLAFFYIGKKKMASGVLNIEKLDFGAAVD